MRLDLNACRLDALVPDAEWEKRRAAWVAPKLHHQTPWQEMYRMHVGQLADGGCLELATAYHKVAKDLRATTTDALHNKTPAPRGRRGVHP